MHSSVVTKNFGHIREDGLSREWLLREGLLYYYDFNKINNFISNFLHYMKNVQ